MADVFADLPCTDVDIAIEAIGDFEVLAAKAERIVYAEDGQVAAGSFDLTSAFAFATRGVQVGQVCVLVECDLTTPGVGQITRQQLHDVMPVTAVSDGTLSLGRLGFPAGQGGYPGSSATVGGLANVEFFVPTFLPQIVSANREVRRRLGLAADAVLYNADDLKMVTVWWVMRAMYFAQYRNAKDDTYQAKMNDLTKMLGDSMAELLLVYGTQTSGGRQPLIGTMADAPTWRLPYDY